MSRSINFYAPNLARFSTKLFAWVFVPADILSLVLQGTGGGLSASSSGASQTAVNIAMAGLVLQVVMLVSFSTFLIDFLVRYVKSEQTKRLGGRDKVFFGFLGVAVLCTLVRCVFRCYELKEGYYGDAIKHEGMFIGMEGV